MSTDRKEELRGAARALSNAIAAMQPHLASFNRAAQSDWGLTYLPIIELAAVPVFQGNAPRSDLDVTLRLAAGEANLDPAALAAYVEFLFAMTRFRDATSSLRTTDQGSASE